MALTYVFPVPDRYQPKGGKFIFGKKVFLTLPADFSAHEFEALAPELWNNFSCGKSELVILRSASAEKCAFFSCSPEAEADPAKTAHDYELEITSDLISLAASSDTGIIHGFMTVLQLFERYDPHSGTQAIACASVTDDPALEFRAVHLCVFPETEYQFIRKLIRLCGLYKYSHVILEFWGMLKLDALDVLSWPFAWSKEQVSALVTEGRAFGMEFIPMFNHFGHASQSRFRVGKHTVLDQRPELEYLFLPGGWTWDVSIPDTVSLLSAVRRELIGLFGEGSYFHIGCDEIYFCDNREDGFDPVQNRQFTSFINSVADDLASLGRKPIMWGDMLLDGEKYPYPFASNVCKRCFEYDKNLGDLDKSILIADWQYLVGADKDETVTHFLSQIDPGRLILSPGDDFGNIKGRCELAKKHCLPGILLTTWMTIYNEIRFPAYASCNMWDKDGSTGDAYSSETLKCITMQNLRKLLPSGGNYDDTGFLRSEVYFRTV